MQENFCNPLDAGIIVKVIPMTGRFKRGRVLGKMLTKKLLDRFRAHGQIAYNKVEGSEFSFGYETEEEAKKAVDLENGSIFMNATLEVCFWPFHVYVKLDLPGKTNLPRKKEHNAQLLKRFLVYGEILNAENMDITYNDYRDETTEGLHKNTYITGRGVQ